MTNDSTSHGEVPEREDIAPLRMLGEPAAGMCGPLGCMLPPYEAVGDDGTTSEVAAGGGARDDPDD